MNEEDERFARAQALFQAQINHAIDEGKMMTFQCAPSTIDSAALAIKKVAKAGVRHVYLYVVPNLDPGNLIIGLEDPAEWESGPVDPVDPPDNDVDGAA